MDVAKAHLDGALGPKGDVERIPNNTAGVRRLVRMLHRLEFDCVVLESTGQYERLLFETLGKEGISVVRMNPVRVRRFNEGIGVLAKNDTIDARMLAMFGDKAEPVPRPQRTEKERLQADRSNGNGVGGERARRTLIARCIRTMSGATILFPIKRSMAESFDSSR